MKAIRLREYWVKFQFLVPAFKLIIQTYPFSNTFMSASSLSSHRPPSTHLATWKCPILSASVSRHSSAANYIAFPGHLSSQELPQASRSCLCYGAQPEENEDRHEDLVQRRPGLHPEDDVGVREDPSPEKPTKYGD
ncbi:hypothetical protein DAPPUDRAFT_250325 [Daphnia pulex]|uniref:Uncharacterized protein n=1 Tax=Daphnia pulex TaxID=6669 RepID=E9GYB6_DAPPU|nr:hypothetical protein DAPPUDRAFT_250325 [Daphnia pulex]|eukprot:EFX75592.1 hypothetical protein DAPPUDRAFT_250325 [Daphnia pulex]